ncbi:MAG: amidohydrolase [Candidatus Krumholzibacteria bacterium]|nr:amidohydrolase [Candidatus Krumholzibacteria bacterium]
MITKRFFMCMVLCGVLVLAAVSSDGGEERSKVESIFFNGTIYTMDDERPVVQAVAVTDGKIVGVGSDQEMFALSGGETERIDLGGRTAIPGLVDAHAHFTGYAENLARIDLVGTRSIPEVLERLESGVAGAVRGEWILGRGWDQNDWPEKGFPTRHDLDKVSSERPIYIIRVCGHAVAVNSRALALAGIDETTPDPIGGKIIRDDEGRPTGLLLEDAKALVYDKIPPLTRDEKKRLMKKAALNCLAAGLVGVHEMGISHEEKSILEELYDADELPFRITAYYDSDDEYADGIMDAGQLRGTRDHHFSIVGLKFYADGSLGARSAALLEDYSDDPGNSGILVTGPDALYDGVRRCHEKGFQAAVHAIGDRGVRISLDVFERVLRELPETDPRHRIEHSQIVSPSDIARYAVLGVVPSMQFTHCTSDMPWAEDRVGPERVKGAYAWRSFLDQGCRIPGGSDFPVESIDPLLGLYAAVTRRDLSGHPEGGWYSEQSLTIEEALRAFTIDAAYASHEDSVRGSISVGKLADLVVLSDDLMRIEPVRIPGIEVIMTVLGGEIVYRAE